MRPIDADALNGYEFGLISPKAQKLFHKTINEALTIMPEQSEEYWKDFALWVAEEIFDENWEYNKDAFAEIACRKLAKLGIVRANGDEWELVESEVQDADSN